MTDPRIATVERLNPIDQADDGDDQIVFVSRDGKFEKRIVKTARQSGDWIEITHGLQVGEQVATHGVFVLVSESRKSELKGEE